MNNFHEADIDRYISNVSDTVCGHLLLNRSLTNLPFRDLDIDPIDLDRIIEHRDEINEDAEMFVIKKDGITIRNTAIDELREFIFDEFIRLVAPLDSGHEMTFAQKLINRFFTHTLYDAATLQLFNKLTDKLYNLESKTPPPSEWARLKAFHVSVVENCHTVRAAIADLIYGQPMSADGLPVLENVPPLTPDAFAKDHSIILPYFIPLLEMAYIDLKTHLTILYSYL